MSGSDLANAQETAFETDNTNNNGTNNVTTNEYFSSWKDRFLVYLDRLEPYLIEILENEPYVPKSPTSTPENVLVKPQKQWSFEDRKLDYKVRYKALKAEPHLLTQKTKVVSKQKNRKGLVAESFDWDEESLSHEDEITTTVKASMAIVKDERTVGKTDARSGQ
nr:hypothetical protein [Tanacetum cinerariifolium]